MISDPLSRSVEIDDNKKINGHIEMNTGLTDGGISPHVEINDRHEPNGTIINRPDKGK